MANITMRNHVKNNIDDTGHKVEALGSWDHGVESYDVGANRCLLNEDASFRGTLARWIRKMKDFGAGIQNDSKLREDYQSHTEEVVAGEKMAVRRVVRRKSFEAPC